MLKENGYQESIINKICKRITNNHSLPQANQVIKIIQEEDTREKLRSIVGSHKIRSTFYTEDTLRKILC